MPDLEAARERWRRVQDVFQQALARQSAERQTFLAETCAGDVELLAEVASLLQAHDGVGLVAALDDERPFTPPALEWVGPYRIVRRLGEGGMGVVYEAERTGADFTQTVALKLIRPGFIDSHLAERLAVERRILARLDHPGIARLVDGGTTPTGQPYVAMEYVAGIPVLEYSSRHGLTIEERLRLFIEISEPVSYAHQRLVVHRDLKPSNILVTATGRPKLLDFGVAKVLDLSGEATDATATAAWITPAFASPEQLQGRPVSTLSDVYALGVLLYEMLSGQRPYDLSGASAADIVRIVCEHEPERPSAVVDDAGARRRLAGDLDTIVLKALAKEPERRYGSVEQMVGDIRRHLAGHPVLARPDSLKYRASKFLQRHRTAAAGASLAAVFLVAGVSAVAWQATVARRERDRARQEQRRAEDVAAFLMGLFEASDPWQAPGDTLASRELLRRGVTRVEELNGQPAVQARVFDVLGEVYENLGQYTTAMSLYERGLRLRRATSGEEHADVAESLDHLGILLRRMGQYAQAESSHREALALRRRTLRPNDPSIAQTLFNLGFLMPYLARDRESEAYYRDALAIRIQSLGPEHPLIATTLIQLASVLRRQGFYAAADSANRAGLTLRQRILGAEHPAVVEATLHLADLLAEWRPQGDEAEALYRSALAMQRRLGREVHPLTVHGLENLATLLSARGHHAEAEGLIRDALAILQRVYGNHPSVALELSSLATEVAYRGRLHEADSLFTGAVAMARQLLGPEHPSLGGMLAQYARALQARGDYSRAEELHREAIRLRENGLGPMHPLIAESSNWLGQLFMQERNYAEAEKMYLRALEVGRHNYRDSHRFVQDAFQGLAQLYDAWGKPRQAAQYRARLTR